MSKQKLNQRFDDFARGVSIIVGSEQVQRRRCGARTNDVEKRAAKALIMVQKRALICPSSSGGSRVGTRHSCDVGNPSRPHKEA